MKQYLSAILITLSFIIFTGLIFFFAFIAITEPTVCVNDNIEINKVSYNICNENICTNYNLSNLFYKKNWLKCHKNEQNYNLSDSDLQLLLSEINRTNNTKCYYNYLNHCNDAIYKHMPLYQVLLILLICILFCWIMGWMRIIGIFLPKNNGYMSTPYDS